MFLFFFQLFPSCQDSIAMCSIRFCGSSTCLDGHLRFCCRICCHWIALYSLSTKQVLVCQSFEEQIPLVTHLPFHTWYIFASIGGNEIEFSLAIWLGALTKVNLSNSTLKFLVESKHFGIVKLYESVSLLSEAVSFPLYLFVTPEIPNVSLVEEMTFSYLWQTLNFTTKNQCIPHCQNFL